MAIHFPADHLRIMDYNRCLKSLNGLTNEEFLEKVAESYEIKEQAAGSDPKPQKMGHFSLYLGSKWYSLTVKPEKVDRSDLTKQLDCQSLTDLVLTPILGISDLRTDERIEFVGGIRGMKELERRC